MSVQVVELINGICKCLFQNEDVAAMGLATRASSTLKAAHPEAISYSSTEMNTHFSEFIRILDVKNNDCFVEKFCNTISVAYGNRHVVLSDICEWKDFIIFY